MARTQAKNYKDIRLAILHRSADLFAAQGYASTSIADLAKGNGISRGLLYHYFASKEALLDEMLNSHLDMMLSEVAKAAEQGETTRARFRATVRRFVGINARSRSLQIVLLHDLQNLADAEKTLIADKQRKIVSVVKALIADLAVHSMTAERLTATTMMFVGMINYTYVWFDPDGPVSPDEYADMATDNFLGGITGG